MYLLFFWILWWNNLRNYIKIKWGYCHTVDESRGATKKYLGVGETNFIIEDESNINGKLRWIVTKGFSGTFRRVQFSKVQESQSTLLGIKDAKPTYLT